MHVENRKAERMQHIGALQIGDFREHSFQFSYTFWFTEQPVLSERTVVPLHFLALKAQLVVLESAFVMVSTVWSVSCWLFYSRCPRAQPFAKLGARAPVPHGVGAIHCY